MPKVFGHLQLKLDGTVAWWATK